MILLTGIPSEPPLHLAIDAAEQAGIPYVLFSQREAHFSEMAVSLRQDKLDGILRVQETDYRLSDFSGVYVRLMDHRYLPENQAHGPLSADRDQVEKSFILHEMLFNWLEIAECRVMNRASDMGSNMSKTFQAQFITQVGFRRPITLVTNDQQEVQHFVTEHEHVVYKSLSSVRSIVQTLDNVKMKDLNNVRYLPTQFQTYVPGTNIRVHVVGDALFATEIKSQAVDYRYASREDLEVDMVSTTLPPHIEARCFDLSRLLRLPLCGIDLKLTPDGDYYCFEVNPSPGYSYFQQNTDQNIAAAIVNYLEFGTTHL